MDDILWWFKTHKRRNTNIVCRYQILVGRLLDFAFQFQFGWFDICVCVCSYNFACCCWCGSCFSSGILISFFIHLVFGYRREFLVVYQIWCIYMSSMFGPNRVFNFNFIECKAANLGRLGILSMCVSFDLNFVGEPWSI